MNSISSIFPKFSASIIIISSCRNLRGNHGLNGTIPESIGKLKNLLSLYETLRVWDRYWETRWSLCIFGLLPLFPISRLQVSSLWILDSVEPSLRVLEISEISHTCSSLFQPFQWFISFHLTDLKRFLPDYWIEWPNSWEYWETYQPGVPVWSILKLERSLTENSSYLTSFQVHYGYSRIEWNYSWECREFEQSRRTVWSSSIRRTIETIEWITWHSDSIGVSLPFSSYRRHFAGLQGLSGLIPESIGNLGSLTLLFELLSNLDNDVLNDLRFHRSSILTDS